MTLCLLVYNKRIPLSNSFYSPSQALYFRTLQVALAMIAACGLILSICAIVSYLPPTAGYCGCAACMLSLITLAICGVKSNRDYAPIIDNPPIDGTNRLSDHHINPNIQSSDKIKHITQRSNTLPDELYAIIFSWFNGEDLARASQVCKQWNQLSSDNRLWKSLCLQESIAPPEGLLVPISYKDTYCTSKTLTHHIQHTRPKDSLMKIPQDFQEDVQVFFKTKAFFKTKDHVFLYGKNSFEIWDTSFQRQYVRKFINDFPGKANIKIVGQTVCLIKRMIGTSFSSDIYIYPFDIKTNKELPIIKFFYTKSTIVNTALDLDENRVFVGQEDGAIVIWDLKQKGVVHAPDVIEYDAISKWNETKEQIWQNSYDEKKMQEISKRWTYEAQCLFTTAKMEAGEFQRSLLSPHREYHQMLQSRVWLKEHTQAITCICSLGSFIFSSSHDGTIKKWDIVNAKCLRTIETGFINGAISLQVAGRYIFGLSFCGNKICQWDLETGDCLAQVHLKQSCESFHVVGNLLFCLCTPTDKQIVEIYNLSTQEYIKTLTAKSSLYKCMQIVDHSLYLLVEDKILNWDFFPSD